MNDVEIARTVSGVEVMVFMRGHVERQEFSGMLIEADHVSMSLLQNRSMYGRMLSPECIHHGYLKHALSGSVWDMPDQPSYEVCDAHNEGAFPATYVCLDEVRHNNTERRTTMGKNGDYRGIREMVERDLLMVERDLLESLQIPADLLSGSGHVTIRMAKRAVLTHYGLPDLSEDDSKHYLIRCTATGWQWRCAGPGELLQAMVDMVADECSITREFWPQVPDEVGLETITITVEEDKPDER